jgi:TRAP-type C4-dicarboxylate transport system substrate-binding protein
MTRLGKALSPVLLALGLVAAGGAPAAAQEEFTLRFNHVLGASEPYHEGFLDWAKRVGERTNGGLTIEVFHSAQLGVEEDIIEQIRQGAAFGQNTDSARLGNFVPGIAVVNGPYFVESIDEVAKLNDSPTMQKWQAQLAEEFGLKVVCFDWVQGHRQFFTDKPVRTPADLEGLRVRTAPVAMNFGDVYPGLQQKAIDGAELVYPNITAGKLYEVLGYANETGHILLVNFQVVSAAWFGELPADYQTALVEECRSAGRETSEAIQEATEKSKEEVQKHGMQVVEDVDMAAFRKAGDQAYEALKILDAKKQVHKEIGKK